MKILITGGTGLIGQQFIGRFPEHEYKLLTRDPERARSTLGEGYQYFTTLNELPSSTRIDVVINLAGEPIVGRRWSDTQKRRLEESRWDTTQALVEWIDRAESKPHCFLSGSAIGYYGVDSDAEFSEQSVAIRNDFASKLCSRWEALAQQAELHCRVVLLRTGIVLSSSGGAMGKMSLPFKLGLGGPVGSGQQWMSWIHMHDYLQAIHYLMTSTQSVGAYNLVAPNPVSNREFVKAFAKALGRPCVLPAPAFAIRLALGEAATLLLDGQHVQPEKLLDDGFDFKFPLIGEAMLDLFG